MSTAANSQVSISEAVVVYHNLVDQPWMARWLRFAIELSQAMFAAAVAMAGVGLLGFVNMQLAYLHAGKELCATSYVMSRAEICAAQGRYAHPDCLISVSHAERVYDFKAGLCPGWPHST